MLVQVGPRGWVEPRRGGAKGWAGPQGDSVVPLGLRASQGRA